jgi:hypothetical protein
MKKKNKNDAKKKTQKKDEKGMKNSYLNGVLYFCS